MTVDPPRRRILLVEDETIVAMMMEDMLAELGYDVTETAAQIETARRAAENGAFDMAILDVNLGGDPTYPVAEILQSRRIPFVFSTGYDSAGLEPRYAETPRLQKPFEYEDLRAVMSRIFPT
jgi:CheY-like chemotaxis protein